MFTKEQLEAAYQNYKGPVAVVKMAKPRPNEKTFRNNKYSVYNMGRLAAGLGSRGFSATVDKL